MEGFDYNETFACLNFPTCCCCHGLLVTSDVCKHHFLTQRVKGRGIHDMPHRKQGMLLTKIFLWFRASPTSAVCQAFFKALGI